jgi:RHS repeat-associated protein
MTLEKLGDRAAGYSCSSENRMVSVRTDLGHPGHPTTVSYGYDALGRRVERTADVAGPTPLEAQRNLYDGMSLDVVAELAPTKGWGSRLALSPTTEYVMAAGGVVSSVSFDEGTRGWGSWMRVRETSYYHTDILGSTRMLSDEHGKVTEDYTYDAFGLALDGSLSGDNSLGYTGQRLDPVTGLYDYGYRDYSPQVGRWTTVDPIKAGENWYAYVNNDPINYIDPYGLLNVPQLLAGGGMMIAGGAVAVATLAEDVVTVGVGVLDDVPTLALAAGLVTGGAALMSTSMSSTVTGPTITIADPATSKTNQEKDRRPAEQQPNPSPPTVEPPIETGDPGNIGGPNPPIFTGGKWLAVAAALAGGTAYVYNQYFSDIGEPPSANTIKGH